MRAQKAVPPPPLAFIALQAPRTQAAWKKSTQLLFCPWLRSPAHRLLACPPAYLHARPPPAYLHARPAARAIRIVLEDLLNSVQFCGASKVPKGDIFLACAHKLSCVDKMMIYCVYNIKKNNLSVLQELRTIH